MVGNGRRFSNINEPSANGAAYHGQRRNAVFRRLKMTNNQSSDSYNQNSDQNGDSNNFRKRNRVSFKHQNPQNSRYKISMYFLSYKFNKLLKR